MKVLIADDDQTIRALLTDMLLDLGHSVVAACHGAEAVELAAREQPDALILDFLMPKLSGLDALREIRRAGGKAPAVLLTAITDGSLRGVEGTDAVKVLLEKPFPRKSLERAMSRAAGSGR